MCVFLNAGHPLRQGSHQLNSCKMDSVERFSWIGFVAVTLVWSLLDSKERSSLLDSSIHTDFHSEDEAMASISSLTSTPSDVPEHK